MSIAIAQHAELRRTFASSEVAAYRALVDDRRSPEDVVPSALIGGMFSQLLGTRLPGRGTNWMKQRLSFRAPARVGAELIASVEVVRLRPDKDLVNLRTTCVDDQGTVICEGEALVMAREMMRGD